ncbi:mCG1026901, partial [Mus musculus]
PPHVPEPCDSVTALLCDPFPLVRALLLVSPRRAASVGRATRPPEGAARLLGNVLGPELSRGHPGLHTPRVGVPVTTARPGREAEGR